MNKAILAGGVAALIAAVAGGIAFAEASPAAQDRPAPAVRADADGDQRLSQSEFVDGRVQRLQAADADRNGSVTREEMRAAGQARRVERASMRFDRIDADDDGAISRAEFDAAREARGERGGRGGRGHGRWGGGEHRMADRGPIDIAQAQTRASEAFARMDVDNDGYLTPEERRAGHREMRQQRRERGDRMSQPSLPPPASE